MLKFLSSSNRCGRSLYRHQKLTLSKCHQITPLSRRLSSIPPPINNTSEVTKIVSRPPQIIRLALVGTSVTLATPVFAVAGIYRVWSAVLPKTALGEWVKTITAVVISGGAITLFYRYIIPMVMDYADLIIPFALSNGISCVFWMGLGENLIGFEFLAGIAANSTLASITSWLPTSLATLPLVSSILSLPVGGAVIGALTALTAPLLWPSLTKLCWQPELRSIILDGDSIVWLLDLYYSFIVPVGLPVGIFSGVALHSLLKPVVIGHPSIPWFQMALPILAGLVALCGIVYSPKYTRGGGLEYSDFVWIQRRDHQTGQLVSMNLSTLESQNDLKYSNNSNRLRNLIRYFHGIRDPFKSFREFFSSDPSPPISSTSVTYFPSHPNQLTSTTYSKLWELEQIYGVIDLLISKKYLDSISTSHILIPRIQSQNGAQNVGTTLVSKADLLANLQNTAKEKYNIRDLGYLEKQMDTYCLAKLQFTASAASSLPAGATTPSLSKQQQRHPPKVKEDIIQLTKSRVIDSFGPVTVDGGVTAEMEEERKSFILTFLENNHLYEEELKNKLGIILTAELSEEVIEPYLQDEAARYSREFQAGLVKYATVVGLPLLVLGIILRRQ